MTQIQRFHSPSELELVYPTIKELRPHLNFSDFVSLYQEAHKANQYELVGLKEEGKCVAAMGYRVLHDFVHGKHLYIDDLVVTESLRSQGLGAQLLLFAEKMAQELGCTGLRLCTGTENEQGKRFYEKNAWRLRAVVFKKNWSTEPSTKLTTL